MNLHEPADERLTPTPTDAPPGSVRKLIALRQRARRREPLYSTDDAKATDADNMGDDVAYPCRLSYGAPLTLRSMLADARLPNRLEVAHPSGQATRRNHARIIAAEHDGEDSSAPDWLQQELARFREREAERRRNLPPVKLAG